MKYLFSWLGYHLDITSIYALDSIENIINRISLHTAEATLIKTINYNDIDFGIGVLISVTDEICLVHYYTEEKIIQVNHRPDAIIGKQYIIIKKNNQYFFATIHDLGGDKNHFLPPISGSLESNLTFLAQKKQTVDYIIEIENTAINNRVDLFSHRGLARELSILYDLEMIPEKNLLYNDASIPCKQNIFDVSSDVVNAASAVQATCKETFSIIDYIVPLSALNITSHSFLVDLSNFVMLDLGQPLHIFDRAMIQGKLSFNKKTVGLLDCLDNTVISVNKNALVLTDENEIKSLVGIIGGKKSAVTYQTKDIIIESASVKAESIRASNKLYKKKTDSAIINERGSAPYGCLLAIQRILFFIHKHHNIIIHEKQIYHPGATNRLTLTIDIEYIIKLIGQPIQTSQIVHILKKLECIINSEKIESGILHITIPWWRQDLHHQDDIAEEIVRIIGFDNVQLKPLRLISQYHLYTNKIYDLKIATSIIGKSNEIISYGIANNDDTKVWKGDTNNSVPLLNQYSQVHTHLQKTHFPTLLNTIFDCLKKQKYNAMSTFTVGPLWQYVNDTINEENYYTIVFYQEEYKNSFYDYKKIIQEIFLRFQISFDFYHAGNDDLQGSCYSKIASLIYIGKEKVGTCGFIDPIIFHHATKKPGLVFGCELNITKLFSYKRHIHNYETFFDISIIIDDTILTEDIIKMIYNGFGNIIHIECIDWYKPQEWLHTKSITLRIYPMHSNINDIYHEVVQYCKTQGYTIR
jgi:phenylalanyl-tRNA synthetase beta subunit